MAIAAACLLGACQTIVPRAAVEAPERQAPRLPTARPGEGVATGIPQDTQRNRVALLVPLSGANAVSASRSRTRRCWRCSIRRTKRSG